MTLNYVLVLLVLLLVILANPPYLSAYPSAYPSPACHGWSEEQMPSGLRCWTDYDETIWCEYDRGGPARATSSNCALRLAYKSRWLEISFRGAINGSSSSLAMTPYIPGGYVFRSHHTYSVHLDCDGVPPASGLFKPCCAIQSAAPHVSCSISSGLCRFAARPHEMLGGEPPLVEYRYRVRAAPGEWGSPMSARGPAAGVTVSVNSTADGLDPPADSKVIVETEATAWYLPQPGYPVVNQHAAVARIAWSP